MKVIIAGSRSINLTAQAVHDIMWQAGFHYDKAHAEKHGVKHMERVISGHARGVDQSAEFFARFYHVPLDILPADWENLGRKAGPIRNAEMADYGDALILVWDGKSHGSGSMKSIALAKGLPVYEVLFKGWL